MNRRFLKGCADFAETIGFSFVKPYETLRLVNCTRGLPIRCILMEISWCFLRIPLDLHGSSSEQGPILSALLSRYNGDSPPTAFYVSAWGQTTHLVAEQVRLAHGATTIRSFLCDNPTCGSTSAPGRLGSTLHVVRMEGPSLWRVEQPISSPTLRRR